MCKHAGQVSSRQSIWWHFNENVKMVMLEADAQEAVVQVKMVTADDDSTTDIVIEGDQEEVTRMSKELQLVEKGKVYVKGLLE